MKQSRLKWLTLGCLAVLLLCGLGRGTVSPATGGQALIADFVAMAQTMNIRNMVSAVYLGPRLGDTLLEVMVVVLAVYGVKFVRETL